MNATNQTDRRSTALLGILLALGLIIGGWVLGAQIKATRLSDRYVTVKGLVERTREIRSRNLVPELQRSG